MPITPNRKKLMSYQDSKRLAHQIRNQKYKFCIFKYGLNLCGLMSSWRLPCVGWVTGIMRYRRIQYCPCHNSLTSWQVTLRSLHSFHHIILYTLFKYFDFQAVFYQTGPTIWWFKRVHILPLCVYHKILQKVWWFVIFNSSACRSIYK